MVIQALLSVNFVILKNVLPVWEVQLPVLLVHPQNICIYLNAYQLALIHIMGKTIHQNVNFAIQPTV